jgi:hypothetical protein
MSLICSRFTWKFLYPETEIQFNTAYYTFNTLYSQALIWISSYFSPFLTSLQIIKLVIIFFINAVSNVL